jgi:hypothetical protein
MLVAYVEEMSSMDTAARVARQGGRPMTPAQRRRFVKKAGRDPLAIVYRDEGMGFGPDKQGMREVVEVINAEQVADAF